MMAAAIFEEPTRACKLKPAGYVRPMGWQAMTGGGYCVGAGGLFLRGLFQQWRICHATSYCASKSHPRCPRSRCHSTFAASNGRHPPTTIYCQPMHLAYCSGFGFLDPAALLENTSPSCHLLLAFLPSRLRHD